MSGHRPFSELRAKLAADPVNEYRIEQIRSAMDDATALARLLDDPGHPLQLATASNGSGARRLVVAHQEDDYLATLRDYVEDLGGRLELNAVFPEETITFVAAPAPDDETKSAARLHEVAAAS